MLFLIPSLSQTTLVVLIHFNTILQHFLFIRVKTDACMCYWMAERMHNIHVEQVYLTKFIQNQGNGVALCLIQIRSLICSSIARVYFSLTYSIMSVKGSSNGASDVLPSASNMAAAVQLSREKEKNVPHPFCIEPSASHPADWQTD